MSSSSGEDEPLIELTRQEIFIEEQEANSCSSKTKENYLNTYYNFTQWMTNKNIETFSEDVFLNYFTELAETYKPTSLWCFYSMIRSVMSHKHSIDIKTYCKLLEFLRKRSEGYKVKKFKVLTSVDVEKFLKEAPDYDYLATKVALIFSVTGACRRRELCNITTNDIESHGAILLVKITQSDNQERSFTIEQPYSELVLKYQALRPKKVQTIRFFLNYQRGRCTPQGIGINKFGRMPKTIASFLGLPNAELYTGHSFRIASQSTDSQGRKHRIKRHALRWNSETGESNEDPISDKKSKSDNLTHEAENNSTEVSRPSAIRKQCEEEEDNIMYSLDIEHKQERSSDEPQPSSNMSFTESNINGRNFYDVPLSMLPGSEANNDATEFGNTNVTQTINVKFPTKPIQFKFVNCTFTNCFNK